MGAEIPGPEGGQLLLPRRLAQRPPGFAPTNFPPHAHIPVSTPSSSMHIYFGCCRFNGGEPFRTVGASAAAGTSPRAGEGTRDGDAELAYDGINRGVVDARYYLMLGGRASKRVIERERCRLKQGYVMSECHGMSVECVQGPSGQLHADTPAPGVY
jgi:hypothetical protein